jgi:Winged helix-turn helix
VGFSGLIEVRIFINQRRRIEPVISVQQNITKHKVGVLNLDVELGNVPKACQVTGMSRDAFYFYRNANEASGIQAPLDANRSKPILRMRKTQGDAEHGEIDTAHTGYLDNQALHHQDDDHCSRYDQ